MSKKTFIICKAFNTEFVIIKALKDLQFQCSFYTSLGFPTNKTFCEKMQDFAKIFVRIGHFFTKINFPKGIENDAEFREKPTKFSTNCNKKNSRNL